MLTGDPIVFVIGSVFLIPALFVAIPAHEIGHALAAVLAGDPSPRNRGYLRPQVRRFLNVYGVVAAFLVNVTWGEPVPVNQYRLQGAARRVVHALGGPVANLLVAAVLGILLRVLLAMGAATSLATFRQPPLDLLTTVVFAAFFLNLSTFAFQLLPFPGLDGWRVAETVLRGRYPKFFFSVDANRQTIWTVAFLVIVFAPTLLRFSVLDLLVGVFFQPASLVIIGQCAGYVVLHPCPVSAGF